MSILLAMDSSGKTGGVCILQDGAPLYQKTLDEGLTHSQTLLLLVRDALAETGLSPAQVGCFAVTGGPGSFTGLRIGMALAKGLCFPAATPAVAVSTLQAMAFAADHVLNGQGLSGRVLCALDARRSEVYWAAFHCGGGVRRLHPDTAGPAADAAAFVSGSRTEPLFIVGDGAKLCYNSCDCGQVGLPGLSGHLPVALGAALAALGQSARPAGEIRPTYLRLSQAERERAARGSVSD